MAIKGDIYKVALPNGDEYNFKDKYVRENYRALNNNDFDTINVTELNSGNIVNTGAARFLNPINGVCTDGTSGTTKYMRQDGTWAVPPNDNTDTKVTQTATTTDANYEVLFSGTADNTSRTEGVRKTSSLIYNPSSSAFTGGSRKADSTLGSRSFVYGNSNTASGYCSFAIGGSTVASASYSYAEGDSTTASGQSAHAEGRSTTASDYYAHAEGDGTVASEAEAHAEGLDTTASGQYSHAEGGSTTASGQGAHAEGGSTIASGSNAHAEGYQTEASGAFSHAEGYATKASTSYSHAEGAATVASGTYTHAEGYGTKASGSYTHTEGYNSEASGTYSHAEGNYTIANHASQHVFGEYNIADPSTASATQRGNYVEIVGGGTASTRANLRTLDWSGNEWLNGRLTVGKTINQIITGTGTAAQDKGSSVSPRYFPAKWTFNTGLTVTDGDIITIKIPVAGHSYGVFISINNGTNYYPVVTNSTSRLTTHYPVDNYITVVFESSGSCADIFPVAGGDARTTVSGGVWRVINFYDSNSNTIPSAYCGTAAGTAAKVADCSYYTATANTYVHVLMRYANTSASAITLNINSQGAKPIYINGSASSASNYTLPAGTYIVFYNGTNYYFRTDGKLPADISGNAATATTASKLSNTSKIGDTNKPVYFTADGVPAAISYTIATSVPSNAVFTDANVNITNNNPTSGAWYYPTWYSSTSGTGGLYTNNGFRHYSLEGTTSAAGRTILSLGNGTESGTAGNKYGEIRIYAQKAGYSSIVYTKNATTNTTLTIPDVDGTIINTGNYTSYTVKKDGTGASGNWGINVTGSSASCTGNAATATNVAWTGITSKPTTISGYGITDAKIANGVITLGSNTITPLTSASTLDATKLSGTIPSGCYTDTKNTAGSTDTSSKIFLIGATSQATNPQTYSDDQCYVTSGTLTTANTIATVFGVNQSNGTSGGISLYSNTGNVDNYGIAFRKTSNKEKHGYVQGDWATYFTMNDQDNRGWVFRRNKTDGNVASIDTSGNMVLNGSLTVGGNAANTSGVRQVYNSTTQSLDFVFVA